jgi:hypothetical protein
MAWREQDFNTSLNVSERNVTASSWGGTMRPGGRTHVAPAVVATDGGVEIWYAWE